MSTPHSDHRGKRIQISFAAHTSLKSAIANNGIFTKCDGRTMRSLVANGWAESVQLAGRRRRRRHGWGITEKGRTIYETAEVIPHREPVRWRPGWVVSRPSGNERVLEDGHVLWRPSRGGLWRMCCSAHGRDQPLSLHNHLAEAVDELSRHLSDPGRSCTCSSLSKSVVAEPQRSACCLPLNTHSLPPLTPRREKPLV